METRRVITLIIGGLLTLAACSSGTTNATTAPTSSTSTTVASSTTVVTLPATVAPPATEPPSTVATAPSTPATPAVSYPGGWVPVFTPGSVLDVTAAQVCVPGYARSVRDVPQAEREQVLAEYGLSSGEGYELDHLIPLELGGSNRSDNLWPEPLAEAHKKDAVENALHRALCSGQISLATAQEEIPHWWTNPAYNASS
jgi:hypothetical protein